MQNHERLQPALKSGKMKEQIARRLTIRLERKRTASSESFSSLRVRYRSGRRDAWSVLGGLSTHHKIARLDLERVAGVDSESSLSSAWLRIRAAISGIPSMRARSSKLARSAAKRAPMKIVDRHRCCILWRAVLAERLCLRKRPSHGRSSWADSVKTSKK